MLQSSTQIVAGRLATVQRDLEDTKQALGDWYDANQLDEESALLHTALAALTSAVATLALCVEEQQR